MKIKGENFNVDTLIEEMDIDLDFYIKRKNGLMLKDSQIKTLEKYRIFYQNYSNLSSLIFDIESILQEQNLEDLEHVSQELSEYHYYHESNK